MCAHSKLRLAGSKEQCYEKKLGFVYRIIQTAYKLSILQERENIFSLVEATATKRHLIYESGTNQTFTETKRKPPP